jgi:pimeloyl-ACP methyl ester carboxylesterase
VYDELHLIQHPVLVIFGERDALIPNWLIHHMTTKHLGEDAVKKIPSAKLIMIPKCGHFLQIEKANEVNRYLREFIEG